MSTDPGRFGYTAEQWSCMVDLGCEYLRERARLRRTTTYTEFCAVVSQRSGSDLDTGTYALAWVLGEITRETLEEAGAMLTAIVLYLHDNQPGPGFFTDAQTLGLLPPGDITPEAKEQFWSAQVEKVHAAYEPAQHDRRPAGRLQRPDLAAQSDAPEA